MFDLILIPHKDVNRQQIEEIIEIKSKAWPYSFNSQLEWITTNLKDSDIHVLLLLKGSVVAYLNLVEIEIKIDGTSQKCYGLGNVCASEKGKGWGKEIMTQTNSFIKLRNKIGLLFCKKSLINFYKLNNWELVEKRKLLLLFDNESIETMIFNSGSEYNQLEFLGTQF